MKSFTNCVRILFGVGIGISVGDFLIVRSADALDCAPQESVNLEFESASLPSDEPFWLREFSNLGTLTNSGLSSTDGWWGLEHVGDQ
jgi:hypothetical protein